MASITLSPKGTQLDNDEIADLQVEPGDCFNASFELDTSGLEANLQSLIVQGNQDFTEVDFTAMRTVFDSTTFPDLDINIVETTNDNFTSIVFEATGPGAVPDTINVLIEGEITALEGLNNDGQPDFGIDVIRAIDANGKDVTDLFEPANQAVDFQSSTPEVAIEMASVTFSPKGTQLDNDEIADIQVEPGDGLGFSFTLDTSGLDAELQSLKLQLEGDSTEVNLSDTLTDFFKTTFSDVAVVEDNSDGDFVSVVVELKGESGAIPNTSNVLVESEATVEDGLVNDGATDIGVTVLEAIDANGTDVTEKFAPSQQAIDLQLLQVQAIFGTQESDLILGTPQNDLIKGKEGNDSIGDNEGNDDSFGGEGNDLFVDGAGNDTVRGGAGNDFFVGVAPGIAGDDLIDLGTGNDFALGGKGADTFVLNRDSGVILIRDFTPGEDRFALGENLTKDNLNFARLNNDSSFNGGTLISDADTGELIAFADSATVEALSNAEFVRVEDLSAGNSPTTVGESLEPIQAESLPAQSGEIFGTPNPDILVGDDATNLIIAGNEGNDEGDVVNSGGGDDLVFGEAGNDVISGEAGNDLLNGGTDSDVLNGDNNADTLLGEGGNDVISGGHGDDLLLGGTGNDALFGDEGHDTFVFASGEGVDIVFDFELGEDAIALVGGYSYDSLAIEYNAQGNYTNISDETGELVTTLIGVEADQLTESNFTTI